MVTSCAVQCIAGVLETCQTRVCKACDCTPSLCTHLDRRPHDLHKSGQAVACHSLNLSAILTSLPAQHPKAVHICGFCHLVWYTPVSSNLAGLMRCLLMHLSRCSATQLWLCSCKSSSATKRGSGCGDNSVQSQLQFCKYGKHHCNVAYLKYQVFIVPTCRWARQHAALYCPAQGARP